MSDQLNRDVDRTAIAEALFVMAFAAAMYAVTYTFDTVPAILAQGIQPTIWPRAILIIMFGLGALQLVRALRLNAEALAALNPTKPIPLIVFVTAALLNALGYLIPIVGTFPALVLFLPALSILWGERRWLLMALSFAGFLAFIYVLFRLIMNVPLP